MRATSTSLVTNVRKSRVIGDELAESLRRNFGGVTANLKIKLANLAGS